MKNGFLIIYTGNGKGKTTAALGLAFRVMGHGLKVCMVQFVKAGTNCGEHKMGDSLGALFTYHVMGKGFILNDSDIKNFTTLKRRKIWPGQNFSGTSSRQKNVKAAADGWAVAQKVINSNEYDLIILDELTCLFTYRLLDEQEVLDFLIKRPYGSHIIITGRNAPASFIHAADIVTEMQEIKHPFHKGVKAQKGIEW